MLSEVMNNRLHIIDGKLNPNPMTVTGTKDLENLFWALNPDKVDRVRKELNNNHYHSPQEFFPK
jgi:hypothetical protein